MTFGEVRESASYNAYLDENWCDTQRLGQNKTVGLRRIVKQLPSGLNIEGDRGVNQNFGQKVLKKYTIETHQEP